MADFFSTAFAGVDATAVSATTASAANVPAAPALYAGGDLVKAVNTRYQADFAQKQQAYATASDAIQRVQKTISDKQATLADLQTQWNAADAENTHWKEEHKGCFFCGSIEDNQARAQQRCYDLQNQMNTVSAFIAQQQQQIANFLQPQLNLAANALQASYESYRTDVAAAQATEAKASAALGQQNADAQNTANMKDPAYWQQLAANEKTKADQALAAEKEANKKSLTRLGIIAAVVVVALVAVIFVIRRAKA